MRDCSARSAASSCPSSPSLSPRGRSSRAAHPDGLVLSRDTGFAKDYGRNPYPGYDDINTPPFLFEGQVDGRYAAKTRLIGIELDGRALAVIAERLEADRVVPVTLGDRQLVVWWQPGTGSALDASTVAGGRDVGTTGAFDAVVGARHLTFMPGPDGGFRDSKPTPRGTCSAPPPPVRSPVSG